MSKKGKVKMGLGDFLGRDAAAAAQPIKGKILPSGPDPNRDPDERRGSGGRRYDEDYDGPGARSEGADNWRRGGSGGGPSSGMDDRRGGGFDHDRGGGAPDDGPWRRGPPQRLGGGGFDDRRGGFDDRRGGYDDRRGGYDDRRGGFDDRRGGYDDRRGGYDDRRGGGGFGDPPAPPGERPRLQLTSRTAPPPLPPITPKDSASTPPSAAPASKPTGPRSNPFGAAHAVDTSQRDREIEAKAEAARQVALRRRDETLRSGVAPPKGPAPVDSGRAAGENADGNDRAAAAGDAQNAADIADVGDEREHGSPGEDGKVGEQQPSPGVTKDSVDDARKEVKENKSDVQPVRPVGRWAALRREREGGDDRYSSGTGYPRRDRDDDRRGGGMGVSAEGRRRDERSFGRRDDGAYGSRMDREPVQPPAPPAGNAFAKRFGSNFDRDADRTYSRPAGGAGGGYERRDDDRRMGMGGGGFDRRDDDRRGGMGTGGGGFERREDDRRLGGGHDRRDDDRRVYGAGQDRRDDGRTASSRIGRDAYLDGNGRGPIAAAPTDSPQMPSARDPTPDRSSERHSTASPPSNLTKMTINDESKEPKLSASAAEADANNEEDEIPKPEQEPGPELEPEPEPEPEPKQDPAVVARASAEEAIATGKLGTDLKEYVLSQKERTTAGALLEAALSEYSTPQDMKWAEKNQFGAALEALSADVTEEQIGIIYAVVAKCQKLGFPKDERGAVVQTIFMEMYNSDLCEEEAFLEWKDDVDNPAEGRMKAVMQTTPWFMWLESVEEDED